MTERDEGRFEGAVLTRLDNIEKLLQMLVTQQAEDRKRITELEKAIGNAKFVAAVVGGLVGLLSGKLAALLPWLK
jgi:hypothetical protein